MKTRIKRLLPAFLVVLLLASIPAATLPAHAAGVTDTEIRIGNMMPYTGPLAEFAAIGKAEAAYFDMVNERGGINGRKIKFISRDDSSNPRTAVEHARDGRAGRRPPDVRLLRHAGKSGDAKLSEREAYPPALCCFGRRGVGDPKRFPWTMGWQPTFRAEGRIYANYIQAAFPRRKIAVLWQNDQFGRDLYRGLQEGLGLTAI